MKRKSKTCRRLGCDRIPNGLNKYCSKFCAFEDGQEVKSKPRTPLKALSDSARAVRLRSAYAKARKECRLRAGNRCEVTGAQGLLDVHHMVARSQSTELYANPANLILITREIHIDYELHGRDALWVWFRIHRPDDFAKLLEYAPHVVTKRGVA